MNDITLAIVIVVVLLSILILLLVFTVKRVNVLLKKVFVDKLQEYDYLISDKEKKVDSLDISIDTKTRAFAKLEQEVDDLEKSLEEREEVVKEQVVLPTDADFEDGNILSGYKKIKDGFNFNIKDKLNEFLKDIKDNEREYKIYCDVKSYFNHKTVYTLMTYSLNEQKLIINELLSEEEKEVLKDYLNVNKFNISNFLSELDMLILRNDPKIKVFVGNENENFDYLNKNITTIYDNNITEGFRIVYKGVIYDYSI